MRDLMGGRGPLAMAFGVLAVSVAAAGCGSSSSSTTTAHAAAPAPTTTAARPPTPHLRIRSPRSGAHTSQTVTVRVVLTGAVPRSPVLRYRLDGSRARRGASQLTFRDLAPGRHHLVVVLASDRSVRGRTVFVVRTPPAPPSPAPVQTTQPQAPPAPAPAASPPTTTTAAPATRPPSRGGIIPQGPTAGDRDNDNNGGPSDGDGNL